MSVEPALLFRSIELLLNQGTVAGLDERALLERFATHRDGRALAVSRARDQQQGTSMWPASLFTPLRQVGISAAEERFANAAELDHAHPDADHR